MKGSSLWPILGFFMLLMANASHSALSNEQQTAMADICAILNTTVGWNCETDPCSWNSVLCDVSSSTVRKISIDRTHSLATLSVALPTTIGDLVDLEELILNGLGLISPLPASIGTMNGLQKIDLARNSFTEDSFQFQNPNLRHLNISSNGFTGSFPALAAIVSTEVLDISNNQFSGTISYSTFVNTPNISILIASNNDFSGNVSFSAALNWSVIDMSGNKFALCEPVPNIPVSATEKCDFSNQDSSCGSCASSWSQCQISSENVDCSSSLPESIEPSATLPAYFVPLQHCWETVGGETYAYFGYESSGSVNASVVTLNVTNGVVYLSPNETYDAGLHFLSMIVLVENTSLGVSLDFGTGESQLMEIGSASSNCPNISLQLFVSYPSASNVTNLDEEVHDLLSTSLPYPAELLEVVALEIFKRVPGDLNVMLHPGSSVSQYMASSQMMTRPLPSSGETGEAAGRGILLTRIPVIGGSSSPSLGPLPESPTGPPGLTSSAKGAIAICVIIGVAIVVIAFTILLFGKRRGSHSKLPVVSKEDQDKSIRVSKRSQEV
jgi:hypothetical protein